MAASPSATSSTPATSDTAKGPTRRPDVEFQADKENEVPKLKGRGRPSGESTDPNQLIKPTKASATPR